MTKDLQRFHDLWILAIIHEAVDNRGTVALQDCPLRSDARQEGGELSIHETVICNLCIRVLFDVVGWETQTVCSNAFSQVRSAEDIVSQTTLVSRLTENIEEFLILERRPLVFVDDSFDPCFFYWHSPQFPER